MQTVLFKNKPIFINTVQFSCSVVSNSLQTHGLQHARPPCPSPTPRVYPKSCPLSRWCHSTINTTQSKINFCKKSEWQTQLRPVFKMQTSRSKCKIRQIGTQKFCCQQFEGWTGCNQGYGKRVQWRLWQQGSSKQRSFSDKRDGRGAHAAQLQLFLTLCPQVPPFISGGHLVKLPVLQEQGFPGFVVPELGGWDGVDATLQRPICSGAFAMPPTAADWGFPSSGRMLSFLHLPVRLRRCERGPLWASGEMHWQPRTISCELASGKVLC